MNKSIYLFYFLAILLLFECLIYFLVNYLKKDFQWLITRSDECPDISSHVLDKFLRKSFDPDLGWVRKNNSEGFDKGKNGIVKYTINDIGSRNIGEMENCDDKPVIATFGDSYTFCRQVRDNETWQTSMSSHLHSPVLNFGVGNYGLDQALIRYQKTKLPETIKIVIMGIVPETICRVHSYWKHYLEFGNILAFKPRYQLNNGELILVDNIMQNKADFNELPNKLKKIQSIDEFYYKKFKRSQYNYSYLATLVRQPKRNALLFYYLIKRKLYRLLNLSHSIIENTPFSIIMKYNIRDSHEMYNKQKYCELLRAIILQFKKDALSRGHVPLLLVMPQLIDLKLIAHSKAPYESFYKNLKQDLDVLDLTDSLINKDLSELYTADLYGGHFSVEGNKYISKQLLIYIEKHLDFGIHSRGNVEKAY